MKTDWTVETFPQLDGYIIEWLEKGNVLFSKRNKLYRADTPLGTREFICTIPAPAWQCITSRVRLFQRLLRFMCYNIIPLPDKSIFVTFNKEIGVISRGVFRSIKGRLNNSRVLRRGCTLAKDGCIYWGDYISNPDRNPIYIYRYKPGSDSVEVVYTFKKGQVRHIHGIYRDPYTDDLWCVTGDRPNECKIIKSSDGFKSTATVGEGDEIWRTVSLLFTESDIFYATDAEFNQNRIYRLDRKALTPVALADIDGPSYYSSAIGNELMFSVTAELNPSQKGIYAALWCVIPEGNASLVIAYPKDLIPKPLFVKLFMPGTINFPLGPGLENETYIHGVGLRGVDNRTLCLKRGSGSAGRFGWGDTK